MSWKDSLEHPIGFSGQTRNTHRTGRERRPPSHISNNAYIRFTCFLCENTIHEFFMVIICVCWMSVKNAKRGNRRRKYAGSQLLGRPPQRNRRPVLVPRTGLRQACIVYGMALSGNFGAVEQWAGRVCSVICQVHTNTFVASKTVPILDAFRLRGSPRERATRPPPGLCGDWPSLLQ